MNQTCIQFSRKPQPGREEETGVGKMMKLPGCSNWSWPARVGFWCDRWDGGACGHRGGGETVELQVKWVSTAQRTLETACFMASAQLKMTLWTASLLHLKAEWLLVISWTTCWAQHSLWCRCYIWTGPRTWTQLIKTMLGHWKPHLWEDRTWSKRYFDFWGWLNLDYVNMGGVGSPDFCYGDLGSLQKHRRMKYMHRKNKRDKEWREFS